MEQDFVLIMDSSALISRQVTSKVFCCTGHKQKLIEKKTMANAQVCFPLQRHGPKEK